MKIIDVTSKFVRAYLSELSNPYDVDLADAMRQATEVAMSKSSSKIAYLSLDRVCILIDPSSNFYNLQEHRVISAVVSCFSGIVSQKIKSNRDFIPFLSKIFYVEENKVPHFIKTAQVTTGQRAIDLTNIQILNEKPVLGKGGYKELVATDEIQKLPNIVKRGICIEKIKGVGFGSVIDRNPHSVFREKINKLQVASA